MKGLLLAVGILLLTLLQVQGQATTQSPETPATPPETPEPPPETPEPPPETPEPPAETPATPPVTPETPEPPPETPEPPTETPEPPPEPDPTFCNDTCLLPDCYCPTTRIPDDLELELVPQAILFSFNGPLTSEHGDYIRKLFTRRRRNPNGTPIRATLFVSDDQERTDYCTVNNLWAYGHEVASFSVNRRTRRYWANARQQDWEREIDTQKQNLKGNSSVPENQIVGFRSPHLQPGGDAQYRFAVERQYRYDSSIVLPEMNPRVWPYTMDVPANYSCVNPPCPTGSFPGVWQIPVQPLVTMSGKRCNYLEDCLSKPIRADAIYDLLFYNFNRSITTNRAPLMVNMLDYKRFFDEWPEAIDGIDRFIYDTLALPIADLTSVRRDVVWYITYNDLLGWIKTPTMLGATIRYFAPFDRSRQDADDCEENRSRLGIDGRALLAVEVLACIIGFIYLYAKDQNE